MRRPASLAVVMVAVACCGAPAPGPKTTSIRRPTPRPASWLAEELASRIRLVKPGAFIEVVQPGEVMLRLAPRQEPVRVYAARAAAPCAGTATGLARGATRTLPCASAISCDA